MTKNFLFALVTFALAACGSEAQQPQVSAPSADDEGIVGGTPTTGDPAIIALYGAKEGAEGGMLCTATVISPTVLLTAAHCVSPETVGEGVKFVAMFGPDLTNPDTQGEIIKVAETHFDPEFSVKNLTNGHDIAVAILATPTAITPLPYNREPITYDMIGEPARLVGYGLSSGLFKKGAGVKREAMVKLNTYDKQFVKTGTLWKKICSGDSGGPVLMDVNGRETVVGVNSFGMIFCIGTANSTRVDTYKSFVQQYVP